MPQIVTYQNTTTQSSSALAAIPIVNASGQPIPRFWGRTKSRGWPLWSNLPVSADGAVSTSSLLSFALGFGYPAPDSSTCIISRIWVAGQLVYDITGASPVQAVPGLSFTLYNGSETQGQDPTIVASEGISSTPAFRGLIYAVFTNFDTAPYGGMLPEIDAEIIQADNVISPVTPYLADNMTHSGYKLAIPDYVRNELVCIGNAGSPIDVFDLASSTLKISGASQTTIGPESSDVATPVWKNAKPYFYVPAAGLSNQTPLCMVNYETGQLVASFGVEGSGTTSDATHICFQEAIASGPGIDGNDDQIFAITDFNEVVMLNRVGDKITFHNVIDFTGSIDNSVHDLIACEINLPPPPSTDNLGNKIPTPPAVDYTKFTIAYFSYDNKIARTVVTSGHSSQTVIQTALAMGDQTTRTFFNNKFAIGSLSEAVTDLITLGTNEIAEMLFTGPKTSPWVSAIIRNTSTDAVFLRVYDTTFSQIAPVGFALSATLDMSVFTQRLSIAIPKIDLTNFDRCSKHQFAFRPDSYILGYASGATTADGSEWITLDVSNGQFNTFVVADSTLENSADHTITYLRKFDGPDIYDTLTQSVYYIRTGADGGSPHTLAIPGNIILQEVSIDGQLNLGDYLKSLCITAGYDSGDVSASGLDDIFIQGSIVNVPVDLIALLSQVCSVFRVDVVESGGVIKFQKKPRNADLVIDVAFTQDNAAPLDQSTAGTFFDNNRDNTNQIPAVLSVSYLDGDNQNAIGTQTAKRTKAPAVTTNSIASLALSIPVIMSAAEALYWATYAIYDMWNGAKSTTFRVSQKWLALEPGDYLTVTLPDSSVSYFKTSQVQINADFSIQLIATAFAPFDAFRARAPATISVPSLTTPATSAPGTMADIPPSTSNSSAPVIPVSVTTPSNTSPDFELIDNVMADFTDNAFVVRTTAVLFVNADTPFGLTVPYRWISKNKSTLYKDGWQVAAPPYGPMGGHAVASNTLVNFVGSASKLLAPIAVFEIDKINTVIVNFDAAIGNETLSDTDWLAGVNQILIGAIGRWELVFFRDVTNNGDGTYTLGHLLRGVRGSEAHCGDHQPSDSCVLVDLSDTSASVELPIWFAPYAATTIDEPVSLPVDTSFYIAPYSAAIDNQFHQSYVDNGQKVTLDGGPIKPWAPVNVTGVYSGSDIVIAWDRRDRAGTDLHDLDDTVPSTDVFPDTFNHFEVDVWSGAVLKRTLTATTETVTYTASEITADGFTSPISLHLTVYQISPLVGRGLPRDVTIDIT